MPYSSANVVTSKGRITGIKGSLLEAELPLAGLGEFCLITLRSGRVIGAEIVSFRDEHVLLAPYDTIESVTGGDIVTCTGARAAASVPFPCHGWILDAGGKSILKGVDQATPIHTLPLFQNAPDPLKRKSINEVLETSISCIDALCPVGKGQRLGLFAPAGVGKSTLLGMLARNTTCDISVIALIGERGREVNDFIAELGPEGLARSVLIVSTSDESPLRRVLAAETATAIAEHYRARGKSVLLLVDSLTRYARAARDAALSCGELPVRNGYPSSVFEKLPKLLERAGTDSVGSITAFYTVLTNREQIEDPLADEIKSILDGHIYLSHSIAASGIFPAMDITHSQSRLAHRIVSKNHIDAALILRRAVYRLEQDRELFLLGGTPDPEMKRLLELDPHIRCFLMQKSCERRCLQATVRDLLQLSEKISPQ